MLYEARELYLMDEASRREAARAEGRTEGKLEMAKQMLLNGFDIELVSRISGIPAEEIEGLK
ncbi:MAG: hypothetical protein LBL73_05990 [Synergistaceae bacterium]|jgi:predicted transposase/invertase (TIGR01784 family)|nr:hypothetical protein [Synergistaceae bacterium]